MNESETTAKKYSEITHAEWILYHWIDVTANSDAESKFVRGTERPLDEAMKLAGGSIKDLAPYLHALKPSQITINLYPGKVDQDEIGDVINKAFGRMGGHANR